MNCTLDRPAPGEDIATFDMKTADEEQQRTVMSLGAMLARLLTDQEIDEIHADPDRATDIVRGAGIETRLAGRQGWEPVSRHRLDAGVWAAAQSLDGVPMADFDEVHESGEGSCRRWFPESA